MADTNTPIQKDTTQADAATVATSMRFPEAMWFAVRTYAMRQRTSANQVVLDAVAAYMADKAA